MYYRNILLAASIHTKPTVISYQFLHCFSVDDKIYTSLLLRYITAWDLLNYMTNAFIFTKCHQVNKANNILTVKTTSNNTLTSGDALTTGHSTKSFLCSHMLCACLGS